jgi:AraC-like DNA-binding protein
MFVLAHSSERSLTTCLQYAATRAVQGTQVPLRVRDVHRSAELFEAMPIAVAVIIDMRHTSVTEAVAVVCTIRTKYPHMPVYVVPPRGLVDTNVYFTLGRAGVTHLLTQTEREDAQWWGEQLSQDLLLAYVRPIYQDLEQYAPDGSQGLLVKSIQQHAMASSVKVLSQRLAFAEERHLSPAYQRKRLWASCKAVGLVSPELVLFASRLYVLKRLLDDRTWSMDQISRYLGYDSPRHLSKSCKVRYGLSPSELRRIPMTYIEERLHAAYAGTCHSLVLNPTQKSF